jgi:hypothetical protein
LLGRSLVRETSRGGLLRQVVASMTAVLWMLWLDLDR